MRVAARSATPVLTRSALPGDAADLQSRYIEAAVRGILVVCIYAPNGNPRRGPKFDYKLAWLERLRKHATGLRTSGAPVVLAGDFNVAPTDIDIYPTKSWDDDALIQPESRAAFARLVGRSWTDCLRSIHPDERMLMQKVGVDPEADEGLVRLDEQDAVGGFIRSCRKLRLWAREMAVKL